MRVADLIRHEGKHKKLEKAFVALPPLHLPSSVFAPCQKVAEYFCLYHTNFLPLTLLFVSRQSDRVIQFIIEKGESYLTFFINKNITLLPLRYIQ